MVKISASSSSMSYEQDHSQIRGLVEYIWRLQAYPDKLRAIAVSKQRATHAAKKLRRLDSVLGDMAEGFNSTSFLSIALMNSIPYTAPWRDIPPLFAYDSLSRALSHDREWPDDPLDHVTPSVNRRKPPRERFYLTGRQLGYFFTAQEWSSDESLDVFRKELLRRVLKSAYPNLEPSKENLKGIKDKFLRPYEDGNGQTFLAILAACRDIDENLTVKEVARRASVCPRTIYNYWERYPILRNLPFGFRREPKSAPKDKRARNGYTAAALQGLRTEHPGRG